jgi:hypothetical protein
MSQATDIFRNTIKRDGVSQRQRKTHALDPSSIKIDERTLEDFLVFAQDFSKQVYFYNLSDQQESDWQDFWNCDPTIVIAAVEKTNPLPLKKAYERILQSDVRSEYGLHQLFQTLLRIARQIDFWYANLQERSKFKTELKRLIEANFKTFISLIFSYEKGAKSLFSAYTGPLAADYEGFAGIWNFSVGARDDIEANISLFQPIVEIGSDEPVACIKDFSEAERLKAAYQRLTELLTSTYNVYFQIIRISPAYFQDSLTRKDHPPHLALFIAFLKLYQKVQDDLNGLTAKHLDFFYKDVLGLKTKEAVPDKVHLFFELAKNVPEHELLAQIRFKAGKDKTGKNLFYTLDKNAVLSTAKVESLRTVFLQIADDNSTLRKVENIHVAPVANSADSLGAAIKDKENPSWATLGSDQMPKAALGFAIASQELLLSEGTRTITIKIYTNPAPPSIITPQHLFDVFLSGKKEWININVSKDKLKIEIQPDATPSYIQITFTLEADAPAVLPFNSKALKEDLGTTLPVMKILLHQPTNVDKDTNYYYEQLRRLKIDHIELTVDVKDMQQVVAFNDEGAVDTKKPFMPFGSSPKVGSSFYVGNVEAFQKKLDSVSLQLNWSQVPNVFNSYYAGYETPSMDHDSFTVKVATIGQGQEFKQTPVANIFNPPHADSPAASGDLTDRIVTFIVQKANCNLAHLLSAEKVALYGQDDKEGFLRLDLQRDFEHDQFQNALTRQMLAAAKFPTKIIGAYYLKSGSPFKATSTTSQTDIDASSVIIPQAPYIPVLKSITLSYISTSDTNNSADGLIFLHLHPFANTYQQFQTAKDSPLEQFKAPKFKAINNAFLLPQFTTIQQDPEDHEEVKTNGSSVRVSGPPKKMVALKTGVVKTSYLPVSPDATNTLEQGALLIGLSQLEPLQSLLLLFQVSENSANAELDKAKLRWHYLANNIWHNFEEYQVASDTTDQLTTSGIVELSIPNDINKNNTILPADFHWLKVSVTRNAGAVSQLINVHTQAARATFQNNGNDPAHFATPLAAQTIGKLDAADSALKAINQPYESFGGLPAEAPLSFYTRISERLRHKGRAITLFDYERLILETFPTVYKVKCINHTDDLYQLHPGHVLISVVPDFTKLKAVDRLQPKVTLAKLEEIKRYLEERNTAFVCNADATLHVMNPEYQKITVDFEVKFMPEVSAIDFHVRKLREEIIRFLSPWAYEDGAEINFGGKMYKSSILNFVEEQPYVDYVAHFKMMRFGSTQDLSEIEADTPRSILVPAAEDEKIIIRPILIEGYCPVENLQQGKTLGYLTLEETKINN